MQNFWLVSVAEETGFLSCLVGNPEDRFCLFDLILNVPSTIFQFNREGSSWVEPVLS